MVDQEKRKKKRQDMRDQEKEKSQQVPCAVVSGCTCCILIQHVITYI